MKNKVNYDKVKGALAAGVQLSSLSTYAQFAIQTLGYRFFDKDGNEVYKYQLYDMGYDNASRLLNEEYPIKVERR